MTKTKFPDIYVVVTETACCGMWNHDPRPGKSKTRPVHWDKKKARWTRCRVKAVWKLTPTSRLLVRGSQEGKRAE